MCPNQAIKNPRCVRHLFLVDHAIAVDTIDEEEGLVEILEAPKQQPQSVDSSDSFLVQLIVPPTDKMWNNNNIK